MSVPEVANNYTIPLKLLIVRNEVLNGSNNLCGLYAIDVSRSDRTIQFGILRERFESSSAERGSLCIDSRAKKNMTTWLEEVREYREICLSIDIRIGGRRASTFSSAFFP